MRKRKGLSVVRISLYIGILGLGLIALGFLAFTSDQASRRGPFNVTVYPGARNYGSPVSTGSNSRNVFYVVQNASPEQVMDFYQQKMNEHYGDSIERCVRTPPSGENLIPEGAENIIAYKFTCLFDHNGFGASQFTTVLIYPGYYNSEPGFNTQGMTVIEYQQQWQT